MAVLDHVDIIMQPTPTVKIQQNLHGRFAHKYNLRPTKGKSVMPQLYPYLNIAYKCNLGLTKGKSVIPRLYPYLNISMHFPPTVKIHQSFQGLSAHKCNLGLTKRTSYCKYRI